MGLQLLWSFGLACLDAYALRIKKDLRSPVLASLFVVGDWVITFPLIHLLYCTGLCQLFMMLDLVG